MESSLINRLTLYTELIKLLQKGASLLLVFS